MVSFAYALMVCGSLQGPCGVVWLLPTERACRAQLEQESKDAKQPIVNGTVRAPNEIYLCVKWPSK